MRSRPPSGSTIRSCSLTRPRSRPIRTGLIHSILSLLKPSAGAWLSQALLQPRQAPAFNSSGKGTFVSISNHHPSPSSSTEPCLSKMHGPGLRKPNQHPAANTRYGLAIGSLSTRKFFHNACHGEPPDLYYPSREISGCCSRTTRRRLAHVWRSP